MNDDVFGPYDRRPPPGFLSAEQQRDLLLRALDGVDLGAYDRVVAEWASRTWDSPRFTVVVGWIERAKRFSGPEPA
jgi:hypothetical protein